MRVTRLEIFGFKSFVERFTLVFDHNLIGVVGPNGCGKSNIVDALRWVLGETHAKQLRGGALEDLIFNGSDSRRALGMAEVSLTIRPNAGWNEQLRSDQDELQSLLETGDAGAAPENGEEDPHGANGAANGTAASAAAPVINAGLLDIPGLFNASEIQLTRRLYRSGESEYFINRVPCRLRDMTDLYRIIGLGARGLSIVQQGQIGQLISKKPIERRELLEEAAGISGFRAKLESAQRKLERTSQNMERLQDIIAEVEKQVRVLKRQAHRARTRHELKTALEESDLTLFRVRSAKILVDKGGLIKQRAELKAECEQLQAALSAIDAEQQEAHAVLEDLDTQLYSFRLKRDETFQQLHQEQERKQSVERELVRIEASMQNAGTQIEETAARDARLAAEIEEQRAEGEQLRVQLERLKANCSAAEERLNLVRSEVAERLRAIEQTASAALQQQQPSALAGEIVDLRRQIDSSSDVRAMLDTVEEQIRVQRKSLHAAQQAVQAELVRKAKISSERELLCKQMQAMAEVSNKDSNDQGGMDAVSSGASVLLAALNVPADLERAVAAVLGERGTFLVAQSPAELAGNFARLRTEGGQVRKMGVIASEPPIPQHFVELSAQESGRAPSAVPILSLIGIGDAVRPAAQVLMGNALLVESLEEGLALQQQAVVEGRFERLAVTRQGEVVTAWGWYATQGESAAFSFARRAEELETEEAQSSGRIADLEQEHIAAERLLNELLAEHKEQQALAEGLHQSQRRLAVLMDRERAEQRAAQEQVRAEELAMREQALQSEREMQKEVQQVLSAVANAESAVLYADKQTARAETERSQLRTREEEIMRQRDELSRQKLDLEQALRNYSQDSSQETLRESIAELDRELKLCEARRNEQATQVSESMQEIAQRRRAMEGVRERLNRVELAVEKHELELNMLREDAVRYYGSAVQTPSPEQVTELLAEFGDGFENQVEQLQEESAKLRQRLEREGEVDPDSIQRFDEEQNRLTAMQAQYSDLEQACATLDKTIRRLKELSRTRFLDTYNDVSRRFEELVPRLFGGGAGKMELIDPEDPLTSGVDISVRPPGKRLSNMELLSGGEKALVATAVLIAMFLHRPSPLCVLDEVDAPLDDANLERFLNLIKEISQRTQFLIVTHNKVSMSAAERLVGITMQESGVSRALSVTLREAEEQLEQWAANA